MFLAMPASTPVDPRRLLPSVDQALQRPELQPLVTAHGRPAVLGALRDVLEGLRLSVAAGPEANLELAEHHFDAVEVFLECH